MRFLVYGDLQATQGSERLFSDPTMSLQEYRCRLFFQKLKGIWDASHCDGIVDLGDTNDDRDEIPIPTIDALLTGLESFAGHPNYKLLGNHEHYTKDARVNLGRLFKPFFTVVQKIKVFEADGVYLVMVPYMIDEAACAQKIEEIAQKYRKSRKILFGHFMVSGAHLPSGQSLGGLNAGLLEKFDLVLLGHVHRPQTLGENIHYVGSPFQQDYGEAGEQKRIAIVDTDRLSVEWVLLDWFPKYRSVSVDEFDQLVQSESEDRFKVVLRSPQEAEKFYKHPLSNRAEPSYVYEDGNVEVPEDIPVNWSLSGALEAWIKRTPPESKGIDIDQKELMEYGEQIAADTL